MGPVLGPHARTDRTRDTRVAEPRLPALEGGRLGEGQRLTPDAPHNCGRPPPLGTAPHHPRGTQPAQRMQAKGTLLGPHTHTPAPTACGWRTPTARPLGGQFGEGERLTTDAPHNGGRHPPGNALLPPPQRATPACKGPKERKWGDRDHKARDRDTQKKKRKKHTPTTQPRRAGHSRDQGPAHTPTPHAKTGNRGGQAGRPRNHTRPKSRPKPNPNHEHHRQPTLEGQQHKPCPNTPTQDPSQDWRG